MSDREDYGGCILGLAIGDALGMPTEFLSLEEIRSRYGPDGVNDLEAGAWPAGHFTDDTQMTLALAEGILAAGPDVSVDAIMVEVAREFIAWNEGPVGGHRAPGNTCRTGCRNLAAGVPWREAGVAQSKGCGTAMRAAPVGLAWPGEYERIREVGVAQSLATHGHPCALAGSVAVAALVSMALDGERPERMLDRVIALTEDISDEFVAHIEQVPAALEAHAEDAWALLGEAWVAEEAVAGALYCLLRSPEDYRATVLRAANTDGDSDSLACIAGAISGAYNGIHAIPKGWRDRVERADELQDVAERLWRTTAG
ncbi:MAG: ADP-ribosylglycohydrolase family protein [Armatimonadota bacterium]